MIPEVFVLGGPNGAGKSTVAATLLPEFVGIETFVNADVIARELSPDDPDAAAFQAGRVMRRRLDELAAARRSFGFESTLASRTLAPYLRRLREAGYDVDLVYVWIENPETCITRIRGRVADGGHHVPDEIVRRRAGRSLANLFRLYLPLATTWSVYNNAGESPILTARWRQGRLDVRDPAAWDRMKAHLDEQERPQP